jgi:hypothetical protein
MPIEFDQAKRTLILSSRGLDMARAGAVFEGSTLTVVDKGQDHGEDRFIPVGQLDGRMIVLVGTSRGDVRRIISMRKANEREQALYGPKLGRR